MHTKMAAAAIALGLASCGPDTAGTAPPAAPQAEAPQAEASPVTWTLAEAAIFPAARGLHRAEDGVALPDGRLIVIDQVRGLVAIAADGTVRPFGRFAEAGYVHAPPGAPAGPNGVSLEPDGNHLLVADVFTGDIWRVNLQSEAVTLAHKHAFGVNTAHRDTTGALWFTQSTENQGAGSEARMFAAADRPIGDGALFRLPASSGDELPAIAEARVTGLDFANGFVIDEERSALYLAETIGDRVLAFDLDTETGSLTNRRVLADILTPDNIEIDREGDLWVASPIANAVAVIDPDTGAQFFAFQEPVAGSDARAGEWVRRGDAGEHRLDLMSPDLWGPLPGLVTGVILPEGDGPVYVTSLGDALVRIEG